MAKLAASEAATFCSHQVGSRCRPLNGEGMTHFLIIAVTKGGGVTGDSLPHYCCQHLVKQSDLITCFIVRESNAF